MASAAKTVVNINNLLLTLISTYPISLNLKDQIENIREQRFKKHDFLLKSSDLSKRIYFLKKGLARSFNITNDCKESTFSFIEEGEFFIMIFPYLKEHPQIYNIEFLEKSIVQSITFFQMNKLYLKHPELNIVGRLLTEKHWLAAEQRLRLLKIQTAKERYEHFRKTSPIVNQKAALTHIASYLKIRPETLSRIRASRFS